MEALPLLQGIDVAIVFIILGAEVFQLIKYPRYWRWAVPVSALMLHEILFYGSFYAERLLNNPNIIPWSFTLWSAMLRMHSLATIALLEWNRATLKKDT